MLGLSLLGFLFIFATTEWIACIICDRVIGFYVKFCSHSRNGDRLSLHFSFHRFYDFDRHSSRILGILAASLRSFSNLLAFVSNCCLIGLWQLKQIYIVASVYLTVASANTDLVGWYFCMPSFYAMKSFNEQHISFRYLGFWKLTNHCSKMTTCTCEAYGISGDLAHL